MILWSKDLYLDWMNHRYREEEVACWPHEGRTSDQQLDSQEIAAFSLKVNWEQSRPNNFSKEGLIKKVQLPKQPGCLRGGKPVIHPNLE